jgi:hypothetical protein
MMMTRAPKSLAIALLAVSTILAVGGTGRAAMRLALSEIGQEAVTPDEGSDGETLSPERGLPTPDPVLRLPLPDMPAVPSAPDADMPAGSDEPDAADDADMTDEPLPEISYDMSLLPEEVRRMRALILEACRSGEPERLRPLIGLGDGATQLTFGEVGDDPISYLVAVSGDDRGQEILAILIEVLEAGYAHLSPGTPGEIYVFPYFFAVPLAKLTDPQRVELFKIVTAGDVEEMKNYGAYTFYRAGFAPDGRWLFFVAGD